MTPTLSLPNTSRLIVFLFFGLLAYANAIFHPFVHDDNILIKNNQNIQSIDLSKAFSKTVFGSRDAIVNTYYRPLLEFFYQIEYSIVKLNPFGYHFINVILHIFNAYILYLILLKGLKRREGFALGISMMFLVHPVQVEAVACISGVSNLLFAFFFLLSFKYYLSARQGGGAIHYLATYVFFLFALMSKEQALILPLIILLYDHTLAVNKLRRSSKFLNYGLYLAVFGLYLFIRTQFLGSSQLIDINFDQELMLRVLSIPKTLFTYMGIILFPTELHYFRTLDILSPKSLYFALFALFLLNYILLVLRGTKELVANLSFALGWFLIILLPVLNIIPLIIEYSYILIAEHFLYLPMIGFLFFVFCLTDRMLQNWSEKSRVRIKWNIGAIFCLVCLMITINQNTMWRSEKALFERAVKYESQLSRVHHLLGKVYHREGQYVKAIREFQSAIAILNQYLHKVEAQAPKNFYLKLKKNIYNELAMSQGLSGQYKGAISSLKYSLAIEPRQIVRYVLMAHWYTELGEIKLAEKQLLSAMTILPRNLNLMEDAMLFYNVTEQKDKSQEMKQKILSLNPDYQFNRKYIKEFL